LDNISSSNVFIFLEINRAAGNKNPPFDMLTVRYLPVNDYK
jgi:hypothetical protein